MFNSQLYNKNAHFMKRLSVCFLLLSATLKAFAQETLYVGTFSVRGSEGIYSYSFDREQKSFTLLQAIATPESPSYIALSTEGDVLYSANRGGTEQHPDWGSVSSFSINNDTRKLSPLNEISSYGISPCHIAVDDHQDWLYVSHYGGGSLSVFSTEPNGRIDALADSVQHTGSSIHPDRQKTSHVHSIQAIPQSNYFISADLGLDYLKIYEMKGYAAVPAPVSFITTEAGAGPRHFAQMKDTPYIYVAEELTCTVSVHHLDMDQHKTYQIQRLSTLPDSLSVDNPETAFSVADIHISPDGKFLYVSNRGHNSLAIFLIDSDTGTLTTVDHASTLGETPRNFMIDPQGEFVFVANQNSDNITLFQRDSSSGRLTYTGTEIPVPSPVSLVLKSE